mmetsp:Transcript_15513/g.26281  ORF Transcript_15513/g.26281 Transcript_15513/m.26281 type:complete len:277 (-) Transcript_15513:61-891(-)
MAKHLARIHGTEEDKVNCPFYFKIGACRHSDRCSRLHHKPAFSPTILIKHLYRHPVRQAELMGIGNGQVNAEAMVDKEKAQEDFFVFFEDMYMELSKFGPVEALHVCDNLGDHMIGHVYCKFRDEEMASDALQVLQGRYYDGRLLQVEFSPVTDFREARCRDFDEDACARGGFCNFLHVKPIPMCLIRSLEDDAEHDRRKHRRKQQQEQDEAGGGSSGRSRRKKHRDERKKSSRRGSSRRGGDDDPSGDEDDRERGKRRRRRSYSPSSSRDKDDPN